MANEINSVILDGYRFSYISRTVTQGVTTLTYEVKGTGESEEPLESWVLQLCPLKSELLLYAELLKCIVQEGDEAPFEAVCEKIINEGVSGIRFTERVGAGEEDPPVRFTVLLSGEVTDDCIMLGTEGGSVVYQPSGQEEAAAPVQDCYNCEENKLVLPFRACVGMPEGYAVDAQQEIEARVTSQILHAIYEPQKRPAVVLPPHEMMIANATVLKVYAAGVIHILIHIPIVDDEEDYRASVCAQATVGVDSPVCCIPEDQQISLDAEVANAISVACPEGAECGNMRMCVVSGNVVVRCIQKDV